MPISVVFIDIAAYENETHARRLHPAIVLALFHVHFPDRSFPPQPFPLESHLP